MQLHAFTFASRFELWTEITPLGSLRISYSSGPRDSETSHTFAYVFAAEAAEAANISKNIAKRAMYFVTVHVLFRLAPV